MRFEDAIQKANDFVWAEKWPDAVKAYHRALEEFPNDISSLMGYAWALLNAKKPDEALEVYTKLTQLSPDDPGPYERIAELHETKGEAAIAIETYKKAAKHYQEQGLDAKMLACLESVVRIDPTHVQTWIDLLHHYQTTRNVDKAVLAALWLVYLYQDTQHEWAIEVCRQMQQFIPHDPRIGQTMMMLQSNRPITEPPGIGGEVGMPGDEATEGDEDDDQGSPVDIARQRALAKLAESIFDEDKPQVKGISQMEIALLISKAVDAQTRGDLQEAQQCYENLVQAGVMMSSICFNLGLIYKEQMRFKDAIPLFQKSLQDPEYILGSHFSLGECYQAQAKFDDAVRHFLEAVKIVDLGTIERSQADELIRVYESLAQNLVNTGDPGRVKQLSETLVGFLGQRGWEEESIKARQRLDGLARSGAVLSLAELISVPGSEDVLKSIALAQEYQRRKKIYRALEELFHTLGHAPDYLPLHHLLASLLMENGHIEEGLEKFRMVARTYEIRQFLPQALATYQQILNLSPLDVTVHQRVIELYMQRGQIDDALGQYLQLADAYYQMAQTDRAREIYAEAQRLAPRGSAEGQWAARILHRLADLDMQRLDWNAAIKDYEEIVRIAPDDERAHLGLFRLYPRTGRAHLGIKALDNLIKRYLERRKVDKALAVLEDLISHEPDNVPLRTRTAQLYLNLGKKERALEHLDVLGDLQLESGQKDAAIKTIEAILALKPTNREDYVALYREMTGREPQVG